MRRWRRSAAPRWRSATPARRSATRSATQLEIARRAHERTRRLFDQQAATAQQLDQAERDERVLANQIAAQDEQIKAQERQIAAQADLVRGARAQQQTVAAQVAGADAQVSQAGERIRKTEVRNPIDGTVLTTYAKAGEVVQAGQPLYRDRESRHRWSCAPTSPSRSSSAIRLGQEARVSIDAGGGQRQTCRGTVRLDLVASGVHADADSDARRARRIVYAIKIRVANGNGAAEDRHAGRRAVRRRRRPRR